DNRFKEFDWWLFSKIDESLDEVYIPYYNPNVNEISRFYPDFIFWLKKGDNYFIVFVDPKGTEHPGWADKLNGYRKIFEENYKEINYNGVMVKVKLAFISKDASIVQQRFPDHSKYWFDNIEKMLEVMA
ncbi:MAG: DEAD/DEAH box helicase family protein, partial [candidate division WOR-3 bacterium]